MSHITSSTASELRIRPLGPDHLPVLRAMLYEAVFWRNSRPTRPVPEALATPELRAYHTGWGRPGDRGVVAEVDGSPVGATWFRRFHAAEHGYGFVDEATPELALAVARPHRRLGIGRALLAALLAQARLDRVAALSLSVADDNPARWLYETFGFARVARVGGASTMVVRLPARRAPA